VRAAGASLAYCKGTQVCNDPAQRAAAAGVELPYVACTRELADVLEAQAHFFQQAVFEPVTDIVITLLDIAERLQPVFDFFERLTDILQAIERGMCT
jgi:hypothetical protein